MGEFDKILKNANQPLLSNLRLKSPEVRKICKELINQLYLITKSEELLILAILSERGGGFSKILDQNLIKDLKSNTKKLLLALKIVDGEAIGELPC